MGSLMARKNLLQGLMDGQSTDSGAGKNASPAAPSPAPQQPRKSYSKGAIGAVSQSIAELKSRSLIEVPADMIDPAGLNDRLSEDPAAHEALKTSLRDYGQQVPVLLRHDPNSEGRYQVVYGRRRVAALRDLGLPVKAMVRDLTDRDLIIAQGQENAARRDLSFIEKANFARQMRDQGFERKVICDALHIDKTVISRMLSVADAVPVALIEAIGSAPSAGRDRWRKLSDAMARKPQDLDRVLAALSGDTSDQRFEQAFAEITAKPTRAAPAAEVRQITLPSGPLATAKKSGAKTVLTFDARESQGFEDWLIDNMEEIHRRWRADDSDGE